MIQNNIIKAAADNKVKKLIFLGSSCIYPKESKQPIKEEALLSNTLEKTNEGYAIAKIAGIKKRRSRNLMKTCKYSSTWVVFGWFVVDFWQTFDPTFGRF